MTILTSTRFQPISLQKWLSENKELLQPPVKNACIYKGNDFIVMVVSGPNDRTDYHINPTEEWFYQVRGDMILKIVDDEHMFHDVHIQEGDMFLLPAYTPHSPIRFKDTVGLVFERQRPVGKMDMLRWYCEKCQTVLHEETFRCEDLQSQLTPIIENFYASEELRTCRNCGTMSLPKICTFSG